MPAPLGQDGHSAHFSEPGLLVRQRAMKPSRSDWRSFQVPREQVFRDRIVFVHLDLFGDILLLDEDAMANLEKGCLLRGPSHRFDLEFRIHGNIKASR